MTLRVSPVTACFLDAIGYALGGILLLVLPTIWSWLALPESWRVPVGILLLVFAGLMVLAAKHPSRLTMSVAVAGNIAWIVAGAYALTVADSALGVVIIAVVIVTDAIMVWLQLPGYTALRTTT